MEQTDDGIYMKYIDKNIKYTKPDLFYLAKVIKYEIDYYLSATKNHKNCGCSACLFVKMTIPHLREDQVYLGKLF